MTTALYEARRGDVVEAFSIGAFAVVDTAGKVLFSGGDSSSSAFLRSSAKPFQVLPFVEAGGMEAFNYNDDELSLSCASHEGDSNHLTTVIGMQKKIGIDESHLKCGGHTPAAAWGIKELIETKPSPNFNNCSGKHTTMLACAKLKNLSLSDYLSVSHPLQQEIKQTVGEMCSIKQEDIVVGVDGCSAPTFAIPLSNSALGFARLCDPPSCFTETRKNSLKRITSAMQTHHYMVQGLEGFDSELMRIGRDKILSKRGAEGLQLVGLMPGVCGPVGVGIAIKVSDGDYAYRVRPAVTLEILKQLNVLDTEQLKALSKFGPNVELKNWVGLHTGTARAVCRL